MKNLSILSELGDPGELLEALSSNAELTVGAEFVSGEHERAGKPVREKQSGADELTEVLQGVGGVRGSAYVAMNFNPYLINVSISIHHPDIPLSTANFRLLD